MSNSEVQRFREMMEREKIKIKTPQTDNRRVTDCSVHRWREQSLHRGQNPCENTLDNTIIYHPCQDGQTESTGSFFKFRDWCTVVLLNVSLSICLTGIISQSCLFTFKHFPPFYCIFGHHHTSSGQGSRQEMLNVISMPIIRLFLYWWFLKTLKE